MEERTAIACLKRGDIGGLEVLVRRYQVQAARTAYLIVRDRALAEDIAQAAFVKAYEKIGRFDPERPFGPWFMRIIVNDAVKAASRRERTVPLETGGPEMMFSEAGFEIAEQFETRQRIWEALEKLPPAQRAVIVQKYYLGMSEAEMAESGASPPGTIKWRLHAARKRLAKSLRPWFLASSPPRKQPALIGAVTTSPEREEDHE